MKIINSIGFVGFTTIWMLTSFKKLINPLKFVFTIFTLIIMSLGWFYNGGSEGAMPFLFQLGFVAFIMIIENKYHFYIFLLILLNLIIVSSLEFLYPSLMEMYPSDNLRKIDVFVANFISIIFIGILINLLKKNYGKEKEFAMQQKEELEIAYKTKSRFLANMSHEIRTPMNGMLGMAVVLGKTPLNPQQKEYLNAIEVSGDRLLNIINEILDYSKIEAGEMSYSQKPFSLYQCISEVLDITASKAFEKNLELAYWIENDVPRIIIGDFDKLRQILLNLIGNAIKFTEKGEILISLKNIKINDQKAVLQFSVKDTGIGINNKDLKNIFESFQQLDNSNRREYGGTGLGLAICKRFINNMNGEIHVKSELGKGTEFFFTIEAGISEDKDINDFTIPKEKLPIIENKKILVVEYNDTNRKILDLALSGWGMLVKSFKNPKEAFDFLINTKSDFDLALIDFKTKPYNGLELGKKIKDKGYNFPLLLVDSHNELDIEEVSKFFRFIILKPLKGHLLFEIITNTLSDVKFDMVTKTKKEPLKQEIASAVPLRILIVEDDLINQKLAVHLLGLMGYKADLAKNGEIAIQMARTNQYDLIFMDIQMPITDGYEATKAIRNMQNIKQPFIVAMTANVMEDAQIKSKKVGMNEFMSKPINVTNLENLLLSMKGRTS